jgi:hypothetical protein
MRRAVQTNPVMKMAREINIPIFNSKRKLKR